MSNLLTLHWSNKPGKIVNKYTGASITVSEQMSKDLISFYSTTKEWQETLAESIIDLCNTTLKNYHNNGKKRPQITLELSDKVLSIVSNSHYFKKIENDTSKIGTIQSTYVVNLNDEADNCINLYADNVLEGKVVVLDLESE